MVLQVAQHENFEASQMFAKFKSFGVKAALILQLMSLEASELPATAVALPL
jgi:hypothetical protein